MKKNIGSTDKIIRLIAAVLIGVLYLQGIISGTIGMVLLAFLGILLVTALVNFCPLYALFSLKTCKVK